MITHTLARALQVMTKKIWFRNKWPKATHRTISQIWEKPRVAKTIQRTAERYTTAL